MDVNLKNTPSEIDRLIDKYKSTVYGIAIARLGSKADAEKFWLIRTTLNQCKKITLSSWRRRTVPLEERKEEVSFFRSREENDVFCAVTELPEKYRMVVYLYYFEEVSTDEIAEIMKVRSGTVRMQLTRAREMLKEKLKGGYFYE